jgi:hypothetical protein
MRSRVLLLVVLPLFIAACAKKSTPSSESTGSANPPAPADTAAHAVAVVDKLPAGVEGVELAENGLRVKQGYQFVKETDSTFAIARMNDGKHVANGGCGCKLGVGCTPVLSPDGIAVCQASIICFDCGLALTVGSQSILIYKYERTQPQQQK